MKCCSQSILLQNLNGAESFLRRRQGECRIIWMWFQFPTYRTEY